MKCTNTTFEGNWPRQCPREAVSPEKAGLCNICWAASKRAEKANAKRDAEVKERRDKSDAGQVKAQAGIDALKKLGISALPYYKTGWKVDVGYTGQVLVDGATIVKRIEILSDALNNEYPRTLDWREFGMHT